MAVSKRLRYEILRRDNHACRYCGASAPDAVLTVDHVIPTALGGDDEPTNLVTACKDCNAGKSASAPDVSIVADVEQDALRWVEAIQRARDAALLERDAVIEVEKAVWDVLEPVERYMPGNWFASVQQFLAAGLDKVEIVDAAQIAIGSRVPFAGVWKYFCGVCWRMVKRRQDAARDLLDDLEAIPRGETPDPAAAENRGAVDRFLRDAADPHTI